ncbi:MAG: putative PEP-binding protein [Collinsella sp.]
MVESNLMLGLRGVRLSVVFGDLPLMQVRAVATAAARLIKDGVDPRPEIMVPLFPSRPSMSRPARSSSAIAEVSAEEGVELNIPVGTMLELPRLHGRRRDRPPCRLFCFGTNDLTQTIRLLRDDAEAKFITLYLHKKILKDNPFETIDTAVLELVRMAVEKGRATNPDMHFGVCGEHGGDPKSIKGLFNVADVDYVSCSPYRVPLARLAAAQAKLEAKRPA